MTVGDLSGKEIQEGMYRTYIWLISLCSTIDTNTAILKHLLKIFLLKWIPQMRSIIAIQNRGAGLPPFLQTLFGTYWYSIFNFYFLCRLLQGVRILVDDNISECWCTCLCCLISFFRLCRDGRALLSYHECLVVELCEVWKCYFNLTQVGFFSKQS